MLLICVLVCGAAIAAHYAHAMAVEALDRALRPDASYAETMRYLGVSENHPPGMLVGVWGQDPNAAEWWWRCSLCREHDLRLTPDACAAASSAHECSAVDLEVAKDEAKAQHPAYRDPQDGPL